VVGADQYDVVVDELRAHAGKLDGLTERLNAAADAGSQVTLATEAYGKICSFFVPVVQSIADPGVEALSSAATTMGETATGVRENADGYEAHDQSNATRFGGDR
jgi:uncharacterized protein YukE